MSYRIAGWLVGLRHRLFHRVPDRMAPGCLPCCGEAFAYGVRLGTRP